MLEVFEVPSLPKWSIPKPQYPTQQFPRWPLPFSLSEIWLLDTPLDTDEMLQTVQKCDSFEENEIDRPEIIENIRDGGSCPHKS